MSAHPKPDRAGKASTEVVGQAVPCKLTPAQNVFRALELTELCRELAGTGASPSVRPQSKETK